MTEKLEATSLFVPETTTLLITTKVYDDEQTTFDENIIYYNDDENDEYDNASEEKHVIVFVKSSDADQVPSVSDLQFELESVIQQNLSVYINEDPSVVQRSLNQYKHVIFVDATVESPHISGNVFSDNKPLEVLEGEDYEEALGILNHVSAYLEKAVEAIEQKKSVEANKKKIIIMISSDSAMNEEIKSNLVEALDNIDTEVVVHVNAPQEVLKQEYLTQAVPILVTPIINRNQKSISGNVYYNSQPLENIADLEKYNEAFRILTTVNSLLETNVNQKEATIPEPVEERTTETVPDSKKIVINLVSDETLVNRLPTEDITNEISSIAEIRTVLLLNPVDEDIQEELRGYTVPIVVNMNIGLNLDLVANVNYRNQHLEDLALEQFDEAVKILSVAKTIVEKNLEYIIQENLIQEPSQDSETNILNDDIDNEYFLSDDLIEMDEGSGNDQIDITEEPSDQIDFGFIQEVTYF